MNQPLADKLRPTSLDEIAGQAHLVGPDGVLRRMLARGRIPNMIFYGPPGTGKTTIANIIAKQSGLELRRLNATTASLADIKEVVSATSNMFGAEGVLLYLDEIQYFNRKQQQSLLSYMEDGRVTLIASTTENPYMYIYQAILSRSSVFAFEPVPAEAAVGPLRRGLALLSKEYAREVKATDELLLDIARRCGGDVRQAIGVLEQAYFSCDDEITSAHIDSLAPAVSGLFDKDGTGHYDLLSCLQKSIRGSDPNASIFYLAKLLAGGDIISVCRRLQVIASEDIGGAWPMAAVLTRACVESARDLGLPEAAIPLSNATIALATAPKSNASHIAYEKAKADVDAGKGSTIPSHLKAPLYQGYLYPHNYPHHYVQQTYLPTDVAHQCYYTFGESKTEQAALQYYQMILSSLAKDKG